MFKNFFYSSRELSLNSHASFQKMLNLKMKVDLHISVSVFRLFKWYV